MIIDYNIFYKKEFTIGTYSGKLQEYDLFISSYNPNQRVKSVFDTVVATKKHWLLFPEYGIPLEDFYKKEKDFSGEIYWFVSSDEVDFFQQYRNKVELKKFEKICIDITGFTIQHLIHFIYLLKELGITHFDTIYTEPNEYIDKELTKFSDDFHSVRVMPGLYGSESDVTENLLVLAPGYETNLISKIAKYHKSFSKKILLLGFPPLQPDMYQENRLRIHAASEDMGASPSFRYAPANDPFVTAQELHEIVKEHPDYNIYLSPISSKAQALGFVLFFLYEGEKTNTRIIYPYCMKYSYETSKGISRHWLYTIELNCSFGTL